MSHAGAPSLPQAAHSDVQPTARRWTCLARQRGAAGWVVLAALAGAAMATVLFAPAKWLVEPLARVSNGRLVLVNTHGTLWQGHGGLVFTGGEGSHDRTALPGSVSWQLRPAWSRTAVANGATGEPTAGGSTGPQQTSGPGLGLSVHMACCMQSPLTIWWSPGWTEHTAYLAPHQSTWPAALLSGLGTPWNTLQLQAGLTLATSGLDLQFRNNRLRGQGAVTLDVLDASSRLSTVKPMGSYRLTWQWPPTVPGDNAMAGEPSLALQTLQGALQLSGNGQWVAGRLRFEGSAEAAPGREEALTNLMNLLGRRQGSRTLIKIG